MYKYLLNFSMRWLQLGHFRETCTIMTARINVWVSWTLILILANVTSGQPLYNPDTEICCNQGRVFPRNDTTACCGNAAYNTLQFACCSERLYPLPVQGDTTYACCSWQSKSNLEDQPYHPGTQQCCNGKIRDLHLASDPDISYSCCGDSLYNDRSHSCCNGRVFRSHPEEQCCSGKVYNTSRQACCGPFHPEGLGLRVVNFQGTKKTCCGFNVFDNDKESCCHTEAGGIIRGLPRGRPSSTSRIQCCYNVPFYTDRKGCCGTRTYNTRNNVCCDDRILRKPRGTLGAEAELCCGSQVITIPETQLCHKGEIVPVPNRTYKSCGDDIIVTGPKAEYGCCLGTNRKYRKRDQICCNGAVLTITSADKAAGRTSCCSR